jgi:hypothetical protein
MKILISQLFLDHDQAKLFFHTRYHKQSLQNTRELYNHCQFVQIESALYSGIWSSGERNHNSTNVFTYNNWADNPILCFIAISSQKKDKYRVRA